MQKIFDQTHGIEFWAEQNEMCLFLACRPATKLSPLRVESVHPPRFIGHHRLMFRVAIERRKQGKCWRIPSTLTYLTLNGHKFGIKFSERTVKTKHLCFDQRKTFSYLTTTTRHRRIPGECGSLLRQRQTPLPTIFDLGKSNNEWADSGQRKFTGGRSHIRLARTQKVQRGKGSIVDNRIGVN